MGDETTALDVPVAHRACCTTGCCGPQLSCKNHYGFDGSIEVCSPRTTQKENLWSPDHQQLQHAAPIHMLECQTAAFHSTGVMSRSAYVTLEGLLRSLFVFGGRQPLPRAFGRAGFSVMMSARRSPVGAGLSPFVEPS